MKPICCKCNESKRRMKAFFPVSVQRGFKVVSSNPKFVCRDCIRKS